MEVAANERRLHQTPLPATLGELVKERADSLGDRVAACWFQDQRSLTYRELDEQADRLACGLLGIGVRKGIHVAVMLPNIPETFITWTAIARLGAVMVPVNTAYTPSEIEFVLGDSHAQYLVVDGSFLATLHEVARPRLLVDSRIVVCGSAPAPMLEWQQVLDTGESPFAAPAPGPAPVPVTGSDLLNIQYTSGTTGFPKGCLLSHEYWVRTGYSLAITRGEAPGIDNVLVWAPFFYMDGMWQVLSSFVLGATAYIARRMSMSAFFDWLSAYQIHACTFPEPALKAHPASVADANIRLRYIYAFGWRPEAKREAERRFGCRARDAYGMTELGTATVTPIAAEERNFARTCGLPAPDRRLRIVGEDGADVEPGEAGELWVTGPGIMWGYYQRPEANAEAFRGEWFRTGDLFRRDADGYYYIVGRLKDMVKRSGENVAAREVEAVLNEIPDIVESAIVPVPDERRGEEVKAYLRLREGVVGDEVSLAAIFEHCACHLAAFKVPRYVAFVEEFPRTATRKIAKQRLIEAAGDLRQGAYDRVDGIWR